MSCPLAMPEWAAAFLHHLGAKKRPYRPRSRPQIQSAGFRWDSNRCWQIVFLCKTQFAL